jgi:LacI family transcriptional regulator
MAIRNPKQRKTSIPNSQRVDMRAVARLAKVSIATVSRTVNHIPTVSPKLAKRVWEVVNEHGYTPNTQARALVSGRSRLLGLIVSEITNPFFPELIQGFEDIAVEYGYDILIGSTNYDPDKMKSCIRRIIERKAEGVAVMTFGIEGPLLDQLAERNVPLVFVDMAPEGPGISVLQVDYHHGVRQGVQHLAALGHRDIAFITGPLRLHSAQSRLTAFQRATRECGIQVNPERIVEGDHTMEGGERAAELLLKGPALPTAIMCSNDVTAIGVLHNAHGAGLRVPDDLSVIGFDNTHITQMTIPPLTTFEMSRIDLARAAVKALRAHLEGEALPKRTYPIVTQLVVRKSTSFPRGTMKDVRSSDQG